MLIFENLISNALKFSREGELPIINIDCCLVGKYWEVCVQDNGIGISEKYHEKIFLLFSRLHGRQKYEGTGIGLSMCKRAVERFGGKIWVESEVGVGTRFKFALPAIPADTLDKPKLRMEL